jgi:purine-nucleoside/S-methyl-5'-thioadenosine phosphorylase / adenosine deaminase
MLALHAANLAPLPGIRHDFFGRQGGVSEGLYASLNCGPGSGDARANVLENRRRVRAAMGAEALVTLRQVHSPDVVTVTRPWEIGRVPAEDAPHIPLGDAMVTAVPGIALGILTADCAPVLFADAEAHVIGAAHAGWKGAIGGVIANTVAAMETLGARRSRIAAAVGPCISQANYEVGPEFHARFAGEDAGSARFFVAADRAGHHLFDLEGFVAAQLQAVGVDRIETLRACTYARPADFFSFRRATHMGETDYGREISAIVLH